MANFTSDEIQAAVEQLIRSSIRNTTGSLGERQVGVSYSDLQEAAAGVFILYFNAPFYVLLLGSRRLADLAQAQGDVLTQLLDAVAALDRLVLPVDDLSQIANARSALSELETAVVGRDEPFKNLDQVPAFRRYASNLDSFIATQSKNIRQDGNIVDTPSGARAQIPDLVRSLRSQRDELVRRVELLAGAIADFSALNLPRVAAQGVISRARQVLDSRFTELSALTPEERLESLRQVTLDVLAQRPLVERFGTAQAPGPYITTTGSAQAYSDDTHLASPASVASATVGGAKAILEGNNYVQLTVDGGTPIEYPLQFSFVASMYGVLSGPYLIDADSDEFLLGFGPPDAQVVFPVALTNGSSVSTSQVVADINAAAASYGATDLVASTSFSPIKLDTKLTITPLGGADVRLTIIAGTLDGLNLLPGDELDVLEGPDIGHTWTIVSVDVVAGTIDAEVPSPVISPQLVAAPGVRVQGGPANRVVVLKDNDPVASLAARRAITIVQGTTENAASAARIGFFSGVSVRSRPTLAKEVADSLSASTSAFTTAVEFLPSGYSGRAHSSLVNSSIVVFSIFEAKATWPAGTTVTVVLDEYTGGEFEDIAPGNAFVLRSSTNASDEGATGTVAGIPSATSLVLTFDSPVSAGSGRIEIGPSPTSLQLDFGDVINILEGSPNKGRYTLLEIPGAQGTTAPFENLQRPERARRLQNMAS